MADRIGDDIGLGGIARCPEAVGEQMIEIQIDVDPTVAGAIERSDSRRGRAASRLHCPVKSTSFGCS